MSEQKYPAGTLVWTLVEVDGPGIEGTISLVMSRRYAGAKTVRFVEPDQVMAKDEVDKLRAELAEAKKQLAEQVETAARALVEAAYGEEGDMDVKWYAVDADYVDALAKMLGIEQPGDLGGDE